MRDIDVARSTREEAKAGFGRLPVELRLLVLEAYIRMSTFAGFVRLGEICVEWRWVRDRNVEEWVKGQPVGVRLFPFVGTAEELTVVRDHAEGRY